MNVLTFAAMPRMSMMLTPRAEYNGTPKCPPVTRRAALRIACITLSAALLPQPANAVSLYEKTVISNMDKVSLALDKANSLKTIVEQWTDPMAEDDGLYVLRFIPIWLEPGRLAMVAITTQSQVDIGDRNNAKQHADAMLGHLFELKAEARGRNKEGVIRELDEIVETAEAFLSISELQRLKKR